MGQYWIRNRGRVQGPYTVDRLHGLIRRGRFNRHFHVSTDKKEWFAAGDFPELFEGASSRRGGSAHAQEEVFHGGGSGFDDNYDSSATVSDESDEYEPAFTTAVNSDRRGGGEGNPGHSEDWDDDVESDGVFYVLVDWVEANSRGLVVLLLLVLGVLGWFVFGREGFGVDQADLDRLVEIQTKISATYESGQGGVAWTKLLRETETELATMVDRLEETASQRDHVKQELLFAARDDIPLLFEELPAAKDEAEKRIRRRFSQVRKMIQDGVRISTSRGVVQRQPVARPLSAQTSSPDATAEDATTGTPKAGEMKPSGSESSEGR